MITITPTISKSTVKRQPQPLAEQLSPPPKTLEAIKKATQNPINGNIVIFFKLIISIAKIL